MTVLPTAEPDLDRRVTEWLVAGAPSHAAPRVLDRVLDRVAHEPQERSGRAWRRFGESRAPGLRFVAATAVLLAVVAGGAAAGAWLLRGPSPLPAPIANGWVAITGTGPTRQDRGQLYLVRDGVEAHALTGPDGGPIRASCATFSPDGSRLAYVEWPAARSAEDGRTVIVGIDGDGRAVEPRLELPVGSTSACPRWSPDGTAVALAGPEGLTVGGMDGSLQPVAGWGQRPETVSALDWSPDGTALLVTTADGIWIAPADGGEATRLDAAAGEEVPTGYKLEGARWSADGRIAFPIGGGSSGSIRVRASEDGQPPVDLEGGPPFAWSRDGRRLAWARPAAESTGTEVVVGAADGSAPRRRARFEASVRALAWSPDGAWLVVAVDGGGPSGQLVAIPVDGDGKPAMLIHGSQELEWTTSDDVSWQAVQP